MIEDIECNKDLLEFEVNFKLKKIVDKMAKLKYLE